MGHQARQFGADFHQLAVRHFQHEFVVNLHHQAGFQAGGVEPVLHGDHRQLDQVGGGALHRRVDRRALGALAAHRLAGADLRQPQAAAEDGLDVAVLAGGFARFFHVAGDAGIAGEVAVDVGLRRAALELELAREAEGAHAVDQAEVDDLGDAALVGADFDRRDAEDFGGGGAVHVLAVREGFEQACVVREVRHDAQFDLRIVGRDDAAALGGDEGGADAPAFLGAHRDVLQVGVAGSEPAGDDGSLREVVCTRPVSALTMLGSLSV